MAIHMGYRQTGAVYTRRSGSVQIHPDRPPISVRARIGSNSITQHLCVMFLALKQEDEEGINPLIKVWNFDKVNLFFLT